MERNLSDGHGAIRLVIACGLLILALDLFAISGEETWSWVAFATAAMGAIMLVTGLAGYCPAYAALGIHAPADVVRP